MLVYIRTVAELGPSLILAPERYRAEAMARGSGDVRLDDLVVERIETIDPGASAASSAPPLILDTTHVKDGRIDVGAALRAKPSTGSNKRRVHPGDLLVSRLRPYLRQIAYAHPAIFDVLGSRPLLASSEFSVLAPKAAGASIAFLLPFFLADDAQALLAAGQEGGHHPRVPRTTLLAMALPRARVAARASISRRVEGRLADYYDAVLALDRTLSRA